MTRAAQYGPAPVPDMNGKPIPNVAVTVTVPSSVIPTGQAALFTDVSAATLTGSNVVNADATGMLTFYAATGTYFLSWPSGNAIATTTVTIAADLADPAEYVSDDATKGIVLKDANGHYWRETVNTSGVPSWADLGTTRPSS